jgi:hypothetical protein
MCRNYETVPHLAEGLIEHDELPLDTQPDAQEVDTFLLKADSRLLENNFATHLI